MTAVKPARYEVGDRRSYGKSHRRRKQQNCQGNAKYQCPGMGQAAAQLLCAGVGAVFRLIYQAPPPSLGPVI